MGQTVRFWRPQLRDRVTPCNSDAVDNCGDVDKSPVPLMHKVAGCFRLESRPEDER